MSSDQTLKRKPLWIIAAAVSSALLYAFGFALDPIPWLVWVAPLPVLLLAPRVGNPSAWFTGFAAWFAGGLPMWWYFWDSIRMPPPLVLGMSVVLSVAFAGGVALFRALVLRGRHRLAAIALPAAWVTTELGMSLAAHEAAGNWYSIAYTQADLPVVLQTVSLTGIWGLSFVLVAVPAAVAAACAPGTPRRTRIGSTALAAGLLIVVAGYGVVRIGGAATDPVHAAAIALPASTDMIGLDDAEGAALDADYHDRIPDLAADGADVVVLPEKVFKVTTAQTDAFLDDWSGLAQSAGADIVVGVAWQEPGGMTNAAIWLSRDGAEPRIYRKQHLIPGLEEDLTAGEEPTVPIGPDSDWAVAICKDLDFTSTTAAYPDQGVILVPALDFHIDGWWHSRIAITRGVEQGMSMVRTGQWGTLTVSDQYGRVQGEGPEIIEATVDTKRIPTLYAAWGDWFAWLCAGLTVLGIGFVARRRAPGGPAGPGVAAEPAVAAPSR